MNPLHGMNITLAHDIQPQGYNRQQLNEVLYQLSAESEHEALLYEVEPMSILDAAYNPGELASQQILDSVSAPYRRFPRKMTALSRALNKQLNSTGAGIEITNVEIGKPKSSGLFASVTAQFVFSDGQTLSAVFHAPDDDPKKINSDDVLIAYRWLLNKREITQVVAPEKQGEIAKDISLDTMGKRVAQLVKANSEKFQAKQAEVAKTRKALEEAKAQAVTLEQQEQQAVADITDLEEKNAEQNTLNKYAEEKLKALQAENKSLEDRIAELRAKQTERVQRTEEENQSTEGEASASAEPEEPEIPDTPENTVNEPETPEELVNEDAPADHEENEENPVSPPPPEPPTEGAELLAEVKTLQDIVDGKHDDMAADDVFDLLEQFVEKVEEMGLVEEYDDLIGAASVKYAELDEQQEG